MLALCLGLGFTGATPAAAPAANNVLLIVLDDVGVYDLDLLELASDPAPTPRMSAMAAEGVVFRRAVSEPNCSPSRAAILTGQRPFRSGVLGVNHNKFPMSFEDFTIPELLPDAYASAAIGKWHLSANNEGTLAPLDHGFDHAAITWANLSSYYDYDVFLNGSAEPRTTYATTSQVDDALAWLEDQDGPWFCYLAFNAAHEPFQAPPKALTVPIPGANPFLARTRYLQIVGAIDLELGRLFDSLDPGVLANTTVVLVGDNGTPPEVHPPEWPLNTSKGTPYQGGIHVPLFIWGAGVEAPGSACDALVEVNDLFATVLDLAGGTKDAGGPDSFSLVPYLTHPDLPSLRTHAFSQKWTPQQNDTFLDTIGLRESDLKYHRTPATERLFDLATDPLEKTNLIDEPEFAEQAQTLRNLTDAILASPGMFVFPASVPVLEGGEQSMTLVEESSLAGRTYWILGSATAGSGATPIDRFVLPIIPDAYTWHTIAKANSTPFDANRGELRDDATARACWKIEAGRLAGLAGITLRHVALVFGPGGSVATISEPADLHLR